MQQISPGGVVSDQHLVYQEDARQISIPVGSPTWYAWLEQARSFSFRGDAGTFTAHKARSSNQRGGWYWYAYRRQHGQLFRSYLGASSSLTSERLNNAAQQLTLRADTSRKPPSPPASPPLPSYRAHNSRQATFLTTKFHIPRLPIHHITRSRLLAEIDQGAQTRLMLVSAPAGSGKTTLLAAWARATDLPVAWLSLEEADNDPARFLSAFVTALKQPATELDQQGSLWHRIAQEHSWEEMLTHFINGLGPLLTTDTALILDDYHLITSEPIHTALRFLIEHTPAQLHLVIGTRSDPPLPLARLRVRGQLREMRTPELGFISIEVEAFIHAMGLTLSNEAKNLLEQRTEGWIAGIQLLALTLRERTDATDFLRMSDRTHHFLLDYISEEILARQAPAMQDFLLQTCVLDRLTGALCDAVTGESSGEAKLAALLRGNLFVTALDDTHTWYRYHPLFAETLRTHLRRLEPDLIPELYLRASRWYEQQQSLEEACAYALHARDFVYAAKLVAELLPQMVEQGRFEQLGRWLNQLPPALIATSPQLYIATPWLHALNNHSSRDIEPVLKRMEQYVQEQQQKTDASWVEPQSALILLQAMTALSQNHLARAFMLVRKALHTLTTHETALSQLISRSLQIPLSIMYGASGDLATAEQILLDLRFMQPAGAFSLVSLSAPFLLGELYKARGQLRKADAIYEDLSRVIQIQGEVPPLPLFVLSFSQMRRMALWYEWNRLPEAANGIQQVLEMLPRALLGIVPRTTQPALFAFGLCVQARIEWAQGRPEAARYFLELIRNQPEMIAELPSGKEQPPVDVPALAARLALLCDQVEEATRWANNCGISFNDRPTTLLESRQVFLYLTLARVLIVRGRSQHAHEALSQALILLEHWRECAVRLDFQGWLIEIEMLTALALQAQGKTKQALTILGSVLTRAEPESYVRLFADEGQPMECLLAHISTYTSASPGYLQRIRAAILPTYHALPGPSQIATPRTQPDPLTAREREVLTLLSTGASNQQIADRLVISLNTAKRHVKNILARLAVTNRTEAVARARELQLL